MIGRNSKSLHLTRFYRFNATNMSYELDVPALIKSEQFKHLIEATDKRMSITIRDSEPTVQISVRELRRVVRAIDNAYSEIEAAVADGDVKEEVGEDLLSAMHYLQQLV